MCCKHFFGRECKNDSCTVVMIILLVNGSEWHLENLQTAIFQSWKRNAFAFRVYRNFAKLSGRNEAIRVKGKIEWIVLIVDLPLNLKNWEFKIQVLRRLKIYSNMNFYSTPLNTNFILLFHTLSMFNPWNLDWSWRNLNFRTTNT